MMNENQKKIWSLIMAAILFVSMYLLAWEGAAYVNSNKTLIKEKDARACVVIDAGHRDT